MMNARVDFGYPWWLSYGHLPLTALAVSLFAIAYVRRWSKWALIFWGTIALWSGSALIVQRFVLDINGVPALPTESFLPSGAGRVLDIGAGTGRSTIMVLEARPRTTLVALDQFGESFKQHFGPDGTPQQKLLANLKAAGVDGRTTIKTADMRQLPFPAATFDAAVSAYAIDHLNRDGSKRALAEAARVIRPGGEFLLILIANDPWAKYIFGPLLMHAGVRPPDWWTARVREAGFQVLEEGTRPITLYILARRL